MADPITLAEIHAAELAALRDEIDQQRTRAEAAEAELREVKAERDEKAKALVLWREMLETREMAIANLKARVMRLQRSRP